MSLLSLLKGPRVLVLGNQKAGTSAIAHLLADYCGLSKTVDIPALWPPHVNEIITGRRTLRSVVRRNRQCFFRDLVKEPNFCFVCAQLRGLFPKARSVYVVRDPRDNIRSLLNRLNLPGNREHAELKAPLRDGPWGYLFRPEAWGLAPPDGNYIDMLAARWNAAVQCFLNDPDGFVLVKYEEFVRAKLASITRLATALELKRVNDVSARLDTQYQPAGQRHVGWPDFFGDVNLRRIQCMCGDLMARFGYPPT